MINWLFSMFKWSLSILNSSSLATYIISHCIHKSIPVSPADFQIIPCNCHIVFLDFCHIAEIDQITVITFSKVPLLQLFTHLFKSSTYSKLTLRCMIIEHPILDFYIINLRNANPSRFIPLSQAYFTFFPFCHSPNCPSKTHRKGIVTNWLQNKIKGFYLISTDCISLHHCYENNHHILITLPYYFSCIDPP